MEKYSIINRQIAWDITHLIIEKGVENTEIDDLVLAVATPLTQLDFNCLADSEKSLKHVLTMERFLNKNRRVRFQHYSKEAAIIALKEEFLPLYQDEIDAKCAFLSDIKIIDSIDNSGSIILKDNLYQLYQRLEFEHLKYGDVAYGITQKKSHVKKEKVIIKDWVAPTDWEEVLVPFIQLYKKYWEKIYDREYYKWKAVKTFQSVFDLKSLDFAANLSNALSDTDNLLAGSMYFPRSMMNQFAKYDSEGVREAFSDLYNENVDIVDRVENFLKKCEVLLKENIEKGNFKSTDHTQQSERSISVYLSLMYPDKYYLYKWSLFQDFFHTTELEYPSLNLFPSRYYGYKVFCDKIRDILIRDNELLELNDRTYRDDPSDYHLLTQDFIYFVSIYYNNLGIL